MNVVYVRLWPTRLETDDPVRRPHIERKKESRHFQVSDPDVLLELP